ncbi:DUF397 domain-containing protein [Amycolatopsis sp. OK19-0408]|uniref:DUF397 domain-containing protein n=1 Tax=Amycolatopsis iheyensis TaxID=2945988 RepID=A0A9X2SQ05_9PSEU|nr:DUF397 domain-containing protein [Amycolatopsis iheyensis]MCR6488065.1 DUF397 domain-containing protein [Amycolatopsis iheyensis]
MGEWRTSRYSGKDNCVEVALGPVSRIRDTKDRAGGTLEISTRSWVSLLTSLCSPSPPDLRKL